MRKDRMYIMIPSVIIRLRRTENVCPVTIAEEDK